MRLAVNLTLEDGADPNDILREVEAAIEANGEWAKWGDGRWRSDTVCSICGSDYPGICGHEQDPKQEIILRQRKNKKGELKWQGRK